MFQKLFVAGEVGDAVKALLQVGVGGDVVGHLAVVELLVGHHVEVAGAGEAEDDSFCLARLLALESFVFFQIKLVRDVRFGLHKACPFRAGCTCRPLLAGQEGKIKTAPVPKHIA